MIEAARSTAPVVVPGATISPLALTLNDWFRHGEATAAMDASFVRDDGRSFSTP